MKIFFNKTLLVLSLVFIFFSFNFKAQPLKEKPTFVLIHGAWHGGWAWEKVYSQLNGLGAKVYTPTLSGLGEHKNTLNADIDLNTHITDVVNFIEIQDLHNVILVGHSYAGTVIAGVADRIPERLSKLVFLDAMIVENGQSALSVQPKDTQEFFKAKAQENDHGLSLAALSADLFGVTDPSDIKWVNNRLTPQPFKTFTQPLELKNPFGNHLPLIYIACIQPQMPALKAFSDQTKNNKNWKYYSMNTGHDAMITQPKELSKLLYSLISK